MEIEKIREKLKRLTLFVAYNTDVDAICQVDENFETLFSESDYKKAMEKNPTSIKSKVDLLAGLINSMEHNNANELPISNTETRNFIKEKIKPKIEKMGGQAGIMSNTLSSLGCKVIIYTELLSNKQADMFKENGKIFYPLTNQILHFKRPQKCSFDVKTKINWVFEFGQEDKLFETESCGDNRFIAASRPEEIKLEAGNLQEYAGTLAKECDCAILAGFHDLKSEYDDGTTYLDHLKKSKSFIKKMKRGNPNLKIQIEFASTPDDNIRRDIVKRIIPEVDCLSMDRSETSSVLKILNKKRKINSIKEYFKGIKNILENIDINCVKIHTLHYFMAISNNYLQPEYVKSGLEFGRELAVAKAENGTIDSFRELKKVKKYGLSKKGLKERGDLASFLNSDNLAKNGIYKNENYNLVVIPTKLVKNPTITVGIGDVISSGSFAVENALEKVK